MRRRSRASVGRPRFDAPAPSRTVSQRRPMHIVSYACRTSQPPHVRVRACRLHVARGRHPSRAHIGGWRTRHPPTRGCSVLRSCATPRTRCPSPSHHTLPRVWQWSVLSPLVVVARPLVQPHTQSDATPGDAISAPTASAHTHSPRSAPTRSLSHRHTHTTHARIMCACVCACVCVCVCVYATSCTPPHVLTFHHNTHTRTTRPLTHAHNNNPPRPPSQTGFNKHITQT
jgi:hypothetical protein